jgi:UDP-N-acetylglucosamine 2-epimerase (non-hydrolysing)
VVAFIAGTTAELIKVSPVMRELRLHGHEPILWWTAMHGAVPVNLLEQQKLADVAVRNLNSPDRTDPLTRPLSAARWMADAAISAYRQRSSLAVDLETGPQRRRLLVIHGDTFSTALGAEIGRRMKATVAHVEAGMRSHSLRHPFPEEANRRLAALLVDIHFAPSDREVANLAGRRGVVVNTRANTAIDALRFALGDVGVHAGDYGVATLHRFELLHDSARLRQTVAWLSEASRDRVIHFYAGASDREALSRAGLLAVFDDRLQLRTKLPHEVFAKEVAGAAFVVTDSGGLQQECAYLGIPTLIHREHTETHTGLGQNIVLSRFDRRVWDEFFADPTRLRAESVLDDFHPSATIVQVLCDLGYLC